jgi:hypothetical protein
MKIIFILFFIFTISCTKEKPVILTSKKSFLKPLDQKVLSKSRGYFQIQFSSTTTEDLIKLESVVKSLQDSVDIHVEWKLPENFQDLNRNNISPFNLNEGDQKSFSIELNKKLLKEGDLVFFYVYTIKDGERYGTSYTHSLDENLNNIVEPESSKSLNKSNKHKFLE